MRLLLSLAYLDLGINGWKCVDQFPITHGPVNHDSFAYYITPGDISPITRIITVRTVIAHHKITVGWYCPGVRGRRIGWLANIWLFEHNPIDPNRRTIVDNSISREPYHSFDEVFSRIKREVKNDHVSTLGSMKEVCYFVHQHIFIIVESGLHAHPLNTIALDGEANNQKYNERQCYCFNDFSC